MFQFIDRASGLTIKICPETKFSIICQTLLKVLEFIKPPSNLAADADLGDTPGMTSHEGETKCL